MSQLAKRSKDKFITRNFSNLYSCLRIDSNCLKAHPSTWSQNEACKKGLNIVKQLCVTNDHAKRGVAFIQKYVTKTKNEDQLRICCILLKTTLKNYPKFQNAPSLYTSRNDSNMVSPYFQDT